jgi:hypothetical protein
MSQARKPSKRPPPLPAPPAPVPKRVPVPDKDKKPEDPLRAAEAERDRAKADAAVAQRQVRGLERKIMQLEAELAAARARAAANGGERRSEPTRSGDALRAQCDALLAGMTELRNAVIQTAGGLEELQAREQELASLREHILTSAASLLVKAAGHVDVNQEAPTVAKRRGPSSLPPVPRPPERPGIPSTFPKTAATFDPQDLPPMRQPMPSVTDLIPIVVDISDAVDRIESLHPPKR